MISGGILITVFVLWVIYDVRNSPELSDIDYENNNTGKND